MRNILALIMMLLVSPTLTFAQNTRLTFAKAQIFDASNEPGLKLSETGKVTLDGKIIGTMYKNGVIKNAAGKIIANVSSDDKLLDHSGRPMIGLTADGHLVNDKGIEMGWDTKGHWMNGNEDTGFRLVPANSKAKKAIAIMFFLYTSIASSTTTEVHSPESR